MHDNPIEKTSFLEALRRSMGCRKDVGLKKFTEFHASCNLYTWENAIF